MHVYARTYITILNVKCIIRKQHSTLKNKKFVAMQLKNLFHLITIKYKLKHTWPW